jgi:uncharacterized protein (TIGR03790 family)
MLVAAGLVHATGLSAARLGIIYNLDEPASLEIAFFYAAQRGIPSANMIGIHLPLEDVMAPAPFSLEREQALRRLPTNVQSLLLVWSKPLSVGCMSVTSAFAAGFHEDFCEPGCAPTTMSPLFDMDGWVPADTVGWWPAMLLPSGDTGRARSLILRGVAADGSMPAGTAYLVRTQDRARNARAEFYDAAAASLRQHLQVVQLTTPVLREIPDAIAYFTGVAHVAEMDRIRFRDGAVADHLTSSGGLLYAGAQMSALSWIDRGATGSYGAVSEPCNLVGKFPDVAVLLKHYVQGETLLESYWKSVRMPGQGLFIGEPLARPFAPRPH